MRLVALALAGAALPGGASPATAQPVSTAPLAANEVLLELDATGTDRRPANVARFQVQLTARAETAAAATAEIETTVARITAALRSAGVPPGNVREAHSYQMGFIGNVMAADDEVPAVAADQLNPLVGMSSRSLEVVVQNVAEIERARTALRQVGTGQLTGPVYELSDDSAARGAARDAALSRARAEAEAYAAVLGMRVGRMVRVGARPGTVDPSAAMIAAMTRGQRRGVDEGQVETEVRLAVDFALAPR